MKKLKTPILITTIILVLVIVKIKFIGSPSGSASLAAGKGGYIQANLVNVYIASARELGNTVFVAGSLMANEEVILMPEISGKLVSLSIIEGSIVHKGELLAKINDADLQAQLDKLKSQSKVNEDKVNREKQLLAISGVSQEEFDLAQNLLDGIKADMDYTRVQIAKSEIRAPFDGVVGLKSVSEGSYVTPGTHLAAIQQINPIKVDFSVPEKYADEIAKGDLITFTVTGNKERHSARVYAIEPKIDLATRTLQLRALAANDNGKLFAGAFAEIQLSLAKIVHAIMIPTEAIVPVMQGKYVFVCKNGKAIRIDVETGIRTDSTIQVIKGIQPGDSVITTGLMQLKSGSPVKVIDARR